METKIYLIKYLFELKEDNILNFLENCIINLHEKYMKNKLYRPQIKLIERKQKGEGEGRIEVRGVNREV